MTAALMLLLLTQPWIAAALVFGSVAVIAVLRRKGYR